MRATPTKSERTRAAIVDAAARLFRRDGFDKTSVAGLMSAAGLTHGGFYAHFRDKEALMVAALERAFDQSEHNLLEGKLADLEGGAWRDHAAGRYLAMSHRGAAAEGCALPALGAEVSRAPRRVRSVFAARLERLALRIEERLGGRSPEARAEALRSLALWAGAQLLARAVPDRALAQEILDAARGPLTP